MSKAHDRLLLAGAMSLLFSTQPEFAPRSYHKPRNKDEKRRAKQKSAKAARRKNR